MDSDGRVLRSGKMTPVTETTSSSGTTDCTEFHRTSKGTGMEESDSSSTQAESVQVLGTHTEADRDDRDRNDTVRCVPDTEVNVPASHAESSRLAVLRAELELRNTELSRAQAATAAAQSRLALARLELDQSDNAAPPIMKESRVVGWTSDSRNNNNRSANHEHARSPERSNRASNGDRPRAHADTSDNSNDMATLANAIVTAVNAGRSAPSVPKFIHELPRFDGTISEWMAFRAVFNDTESMFSDVQNVARIRRSLRGSAYDTVRALLYTATNPYEILDTLERRYGRPEVLILSEIENVKRMPRLSEDGRNITSFASRVSNTVAAIKALEQPQYLYSPELVSRVVDKLSVILKYKWYEFKAAHSGAPELVLLSRFLNMMGDQCGAMFAYEASRNEHRSRHKAKAVNVVRENRRSNRARSDSSSCTESERENETPTVAALSKVASKKIKKSRPKPFSPPQVKRSEEPAGLKCALCAGEHGADVCADFAKLTVCDRWETAKQYKLCFRCLGNAHKRFVKCKYVPCGVRGCEASHHKLLHGSEATVRSDSRSGGRPPPAHGNVSSVNHAHKTNTYLKIVPVEITGPLGTIETHALLDEGSTITLIERGVADDVIARGRSQLLSFEGVGGNKIDEADSCLINLRIRGLCSRNLESMSAYTVGQLNLAAQEVERDLVRRYSHLAEIEDELCYERAKPTVLIGQDNWHLITSRQLLVGNRDEPVASLTKLGWVLHGREARSHRTVATVNHVRPIANEDPALQLIRDYFSIESLGIEPRKPKSDPDERALAILDKTCRKIEGNRYETGLLWRSDDEVMPNNRGQALRRLFNLESKLDREPGLKAEYSNQISNLIINGYAERVEAPPTSPRSWYLPHFSVVHPQKGKIRVVFDAASKSGGKSLNDALLAGPDLLQSLFGVLVRFREGRVAVVADIKEMFLQIKIIEQDRDSLRFLWRGEDRVGPPQEYRMTSLIFGAASSPCTAIYVKNKNADCQREQYPQVARATVRNFYMDDFLGAFNDETVARQAVNEMYKVHSAASFELRGWASNEPAVVEDVANVRASETTTLGKSETERTLGLIWNHKRDTLGFNVNLRNTPDSVVRGEVLPTKRQVTSAVMSVFDPLGLISPVTMVGKSLIQDIWRSGIGWDDPVRPPPVEQNTVWQTFINNLQLLKALEIERFIPALANEVVLHVFCDASEKVYSAAVYFVSTGADGIKRSKLVAGKAKVAPLKPISIPRLELQAAVLGSRLAESVKRETDYNIKKCYYWSDSKTVLAWVKSDPRTFKSFVAHRLAEIESLTAPTDWRWVPSAQNVADDATKGIPANFNANHRWFFGPDFICSDPETWPKEKQVPEPSPPSGEERTLKVHSVHTALTSVRQSFSYLPEVGRFSRYSRLLRATAATLLAAEVFKAMLLKRKHSKTLTNTHMQLAEMLLIRRSQHVSYGEESACLEAGRPMPRSSPLRKLAVKKHSNNVLYLDSRIKDEKHCLPILHAKEETTRLMIHHTHCIFNHGNHNTVMNELQQRYYIVGLRSAIRYICSSCQWCRTYRGTPQKLPIGDLPVERLANNQPPFTATAVDYFGPMHITVGRRHEKRWCALYTCLTTRAVHLELAASLSASSMILTLRRMMARRGAPTVIYSDNGTNFVGAEREISVAMQSCDEAMHMFAQEKRIQWKRIPPGAPSMGGAWERLVRSVKTALKVTLKEKYPREEVLHTLLLEAEHMVNSRPLTPVNPNVAEEALTPNHFLIGRSNALQPIGTFKDGSMSIHNWTTAQALADRFWSRWLREYKPQLSPRIGVRSHSSDIQVDDIVLIVDGTLPRGVWPRGQVVKTYPGTDGRVRVAEVRTKAGLVRRPASRLIVLTQKTT